MDRNTTVEAVTLDEAGAGVGHVDDGEGVVEVHVADLLPGERAKVAIEHRSPHRPLAWGRVTDRLGPSSPDRVAPACAAFGTCGGCVWQHLAYPAQLVEKKRRLARALGDAAIALGALPPIAEVAPSPAPLGYRNKGKYVAGTRDGRLVLGAYAPRTHSVIDTGGGRVVAPPIDELARVTRDAAEAAGLAAYDEGARAGDLRYVIIRADVSGDALVVLVAPSSAPRARLQAAADAVKRHPRVKGVLLMRNDRSDAAIVTDDVEPLTGAATLIEHVAGCPVEVGAGEFLQVNRDQARAIYARVADLVAPAPRVLDLYSGLGGIALTLARRGADVDAIEIDPAATAALARAAKAGGLDDKVTVHTGDVASAQALKPPDAIVVNPPRKGLSGEARAALVFLAPERIVYVSCGPESLGRDLAALAPRYRPDVIEPFDLMPGTAQVETVVRLRRAPEAGPAA